MTIFSAVSGPLNGQQRCFSLKERSFSLAFLFLPYFIILEWELMILYKPMPKYSRTMLVKLECAYRSPGNVLQCRVFESTSGVATKMPHF